MLLDLAFSNPLFWAMLVFSTIFSIVLHELGHGFAATWQGDSTPRLRGHLTWNPVVHMGWISLILCAVMGIAWGRMPVDPSRFRSRRWGSAMVAFAGPAVNLLLVLVAALVLRAAGDPGSGHAFHGIYTGFWMIIAAQNVILFLFNLIPVPPLDGFTVLDETFDLGALGNALRQLGMFGILIAVLIAQSAWFDGVVDQCVNLALGRTP